MAKLAISNKKTLDAFDQLKEVVWGYDFTWLANEANVCKATLYNWCEGKTKHPRFTTLVRVAKAVGYKLVLVKRGAPVLRIVK